MEPRQNDRVRELRGLVERIKRGDCILVLGPRVAIRPDDPGRTPLGELLAAELLAGLDAPPGEVAHAITNLRRAADLHERIRKDRVELELTVNEFYEREASATTTFHRDLAALPFRLCVSASPDSLMLRAFQDAGKSPQKGYYNFRQKTFTRLSTPAAGSPLVFHLFGHYEDPTSLVLTEGDLIEFIVNVVKGVPAIPDQVRSMLADQAASFLFLGFGFHHWYLRVLLQVLNVYGHRSKAFAFEDKQFFDHPDHEQAVGFFSGERLIEFRPLLWEDFAQQLRAAYETAAPRQGVWPSAPATPPPDAPKAFVSYASEDREAVEALAEQLESSGIAVWQDKQDLRAGDNWNRVLIDVIEKRVNYVIVVQTPAMSSRIEGVFQDEIDAALKRQSKMGEYEGHQLRFLLPVRLGECDPLSKLKHMHAIDVGDAAGITALVQSIDEDWQRRTALKARAEAVA